MRGSPTGPTIVKVVEESEGERERQAPDYLTLVQDRGKFAGPGLPRPLPSVRPAITRIAQGRERHVKNLGDFLGVGRQHRIALDQSDEGRHGDIGSVGAPTGESTEHANVMRCDADFFVSLAQGGSEQIFVAMIEAAAGKGDLSAMTGKAIGTARIEDLEDAVAMNQRDQHSGGFFVAGRGHRDGIDEMELAPHAFDVGVNIVNFVVVFHQSDSAGLG